MKKFTKIILSLVLVLAMLVLPVCGNAASYNADEATPATQGNITAVNYYDYTFSPYRDIIVWATEDTTASISSLTGQQVGTFAWFYNFVLEYNETNGTWVVTKADMTMTDSANQSEAELLGPGKMIVMFHDSVVKEQQESYDFFLSTVEVGREYYLSVDPSEVFEVYDLVDGVFLSTEKVEVAPPASEEPSESEKESEKAPAESEKESENAGNKNEQPASQVSPLVIATVVVVLVAVAGAVVMVMKRKKD